MQSERLQTQSSSPLMLGSLLLLQPRATTVANYILLGDPDIPTCMENIIDDVLQIQEITFFFNDKPCHSSFKSSSFTFSCEIL